MRGGDAGDPCLRRLSKTVGEIEPFLIDGDMNQAPAARRDGGADTGKARPLDPDRLAGIQQQAAGEIDRLADAADDKDILRRTIDAARLAQILGDRLAKRWIAAGIAAIHHLGTRMPPGAGEEPRPERKRKVAVVRQARHETGPPFAGWVTRPVIRGIEQDGAAHGDLGCLLCGCLQCLTRGGAKIGKVVGDEGAGAAARHQITFAEELIEGGEDGVARDAVLFGQSAAGRNAVSGTQPSGENTLAQIGIDLPEQRVG